MPDITDLSEELRQPGRWPAPTVNVPTPKRVIGLKNTGDGVNPKDRVGATKIDPSLIPVSAKYELAKALADGGLFKYGEYNWRVEPVQLMTYIAAAERHLDSFKEGEEQAGDSLAHHLGHIMACCAIMIDALHQGKAIDNRPINGKPEVIQEATDWLRERAKR